TSAFEFKGKNQNIRVVGERLNAGYVIEGSVQRAGDRVRVTAQLNRTSDGYHLWSETYDRPAGDVFQLQDEISSAIATALRVRLLDSGTQEHTPNSEAHVLYLRGRYFWHQRSEQSIRKAITYFEQAIQTDPKYGQAYAAFADCYTVLVSNDW